jgi:hypothetical protein
VSGVKSKHFFVVIFFREACSLEYNGSTTTWYLTGKKHINEGQFCSLKASTSKLISYIEMQVAALVLLSASAVYAQQKYHYATFDNKIVYFPHPDGIWETLPAVDNVWAFDGTNMAGLSPEAKSAVEKKLSELGPVNQQATPAPDAGKATEEKPKETPVTAEKTSESPKVNEPEKENSKAGESKLENADAKKEETELAQPNLVSANNTQNATGTANVTAEASANITANVTTSAKPRASDANTGSALTVTSAALVGAVALSCKHF